MKNKLNRGGAKQLKTWKHPLNEAKSNMQIRPILEQSSMFEESVASKKLGISKGNKDSKGVKSTLNKLV